MTTIKISGAWFSFIRLFIVNKILAYNTSAVPVARPVHRGSRIAL